MGQIGNLEPNPQKSLIEAARPIELHRTSASDDTTDLQRAVLERVLRSETFRRSQRLREFLRFVGERTLDGRADEITEHSIGDLVFNRKENFNPQDDNIVRSTARSLRQKLRDYFSGEGKAEPYRIEIPKGSYAPVFVATAEVPTSSRAFSWTSLSVVMTLLVLATVSTAAAVLMFIENRALSSSAGLGRVERNLLSALLEPNSHLHLVVSDGLYCDLTIAQDSFSPLEDYADKKPFDSPTSPQPDKISEDLWQLIRRGQYTNVAEAKAATQIGTLLGRQFEVKQHHARSVTMNLLQMGDHFVILGGRRANPWAGLYEQELHFQMEFPPRAEAAVFRNRNPKGGEREIYENILDDRQTGKTYARIVLSPGLSGTGKVLLAAGNSGAATAAAAELLIQPRMLAEVEARLGKQVDPSLKHLEMIIERDVVGGNTRDFRIVALR
ncbi:MAG: hypothetical protein KIT83_21445 [Bryobacterales bacterium]|nr:hypothetical protein [Bryobacterales bacterium]